MSQQQNDAYFTNLMNDGTDYEFMDEPLDQGDQSSPISPQIETTKKPQRGGNFTTEEDSMLISAWLNISLDPVQGNEQKSKAYWLRVWEYFHQYKTFSSNRSQTSLMNRWSAIQLATNKFSGCFAQIQRLNQSGKTDKDKILDAKKLYKELYKSSFPFEHCWHELRDQPKWREEYSMKKQKPKKVATPGVCSPSAPDSINLEDHDVSHNDNVDLERPPGRKAEKERLNKRKNKDRGNEGGSPILILLEDLKEDRKKMNDKKIEMYERSYLQEQEKIDNEKKRTQTEQEKVDNEKEKIRMEQLKEEERIMSIDTSGLPSLQAEYLHRRQMEILHKKIYKTQPNIYFQLLITQLHSLLISMARNSVMKMIIDDSDSDNELEIFAIAALEEERLNNERQLGLRRGSIQGHTVIYRNRIQGHKRLYQDYFSETPIYPPNLFRRRFRMSRYLFLRILSMVEAYDPYFVQKKDAIGVLGLSSLQKMTAAMRMLAYGVAADSVDDYVRIGESTAIESLQRFVQAVVAIFSDVYLRAPNKDDIAKLLEVGKNRGFPGMLGSIDCMHWKWKNCPTAWKGMYCGHIHEPTIILEAVASYDLWIWHAFFGLPGSHNDINVLERSSVFSLLTEGRAPQVDYSINGNDYTMGYYLADGIYPQWSTFVKTIPSPRGNKQIHFAKAQESARKDVERAFGVLQARFSIVRGPARFWKVETLKVIMKACIILHNMIVEDERNEQNIDCNYDAIDETLPPAVSHERTPELYDFIQNHHRIRDRQTHSKLQADLVEHLWHLHGDLSHKIWGDVGAEKNVNEQSNNVNVEVVGEEEQGS
ncbi:unnamed protein product [Camellia sinensis]